LTGSARCAFAQIKSSLSFSNGSNDTHVSVQRLHHSGSACILTISSRFSAVLTINPPFFIAQETSLVVERSTVCGSVGGDMELSLPGMPSTGTPHAKDSASPK
jgi:hypothetical protein